MLVWFRDLTEYSCPITSIVRLEPLYHGDVKTVDDSEPDSTVGFELLRRIYDRKLGLLLRGARIMLDELENQVVERALKVVANLPD